MKTKSTIKDIISRFPKKRPPLSKAYQKIYLEYHKKNRQGKLPASACSKFAETWMHKQVAADLKGSTNRATLEIGAGILNQLNYETTYPYDIVEKEAGYYQNSKNLYRLRNIYHDIAQVDGTATHNRITAIACFEHILDLPAVVARTCRLLRSGGTLRVAIPNEGSLVWKLGWKFTSGLDFRIRYGLKFDPLLKYEHVNTASEIEHILNYFYSNIRLTFYGLSKKTALYLFFECLQPRLDRAQRFMSQC